MDVSHLNNFLSVIICTYNRGLSLQKTLDSILKQDTHDLFQYELIIVDNNSTDQTQDIVHQCIELQKNKEIRYVFEKNQGLSHARNKGIQEAKGIILVFTDDDVLVHKDWLFNIFSTFKNKNCDALGGKIIPQYPEKPPLWIKKNWDILQGPIVAHNYGNEIIPYETKNMCPFVGANMAVKKDVFNAIGNFDTTLGYGAGMGGEDSDIFRRLLKYNKKVYYCGKSIVWHPVDKNRMKLRYIAKWSIQLGKYNVYKKREVIPADSILWFGIPRYLFRIVLCEAACIIFKIFDKRNFLKSWMLLFENIGYILILKEKKIQA